jgi:hypothetical protein
MGDLRSCLVEQLEDAKRVHVKQGDIVRFSWGCENSPVHSERDMVCDRVFLTVHFGSEKELRGIICDFRNVQYR